MSVYRNQSFLQTQVLDPVFSNNNRCVFKIPALICAKKSICLGDLGLTTTGTPIYNTIGGVANLIKTVSVRVAGTQVDFNNRCAVSNVLENLRSKPTKANNIDNKTVKNSLDFANSLVNFPVTVPVDDQNQRVVASNTRPFVSANTDGMVYLYQLLGFFNGNHNVAGVSAELLPLYMFKDVGDIELTIEWQTDSIKVINQASALTILNPVLIMDCLDKTNMLYDALDQLKTPVAVNFSRLEHESLQYGAGDAQVRERLNQVSGKFVKRLVMFGKSNAVNNNYGDTRADAFPNENIQLIVNGKQLLDFRSEESAEKVSHFLNAWGDYICPPGGRFYGEAQNSANNTMDAQTNVLNDIVGKTSMFGVFLNTRVQYIELDYTHDDNATVPVVDGELNFIYETDNFVGVMGGQLTLTN